jgi:glutathione S-transferase
VLFLLEEMGVEYEHVNLNLKEGEHKSPDYLQINPLGQVPTLQDGDLTLVESVAICLYLTDKFPEKQLAPAVGTPERGSYYQWCVFVSGSFEPAVMSIFAAKSQGEEAQQKAQAKVDEVVNVIRKALEGRQYLVGDRLTTADLLIGSTLGWIQMTGVLKPEGHLAEYMQRVTGRPSFQKLFSH